MAQSKKIQKAVKVAAPVTGLGETIEQISALVDEKANAVLEHVPQIKKVSAEKRQAFFQACYEFGICERRRRKLARKVNGSGREED